jgi:hypothetical protein
MQKIHDSTGATTPRASQRVWPVPLRTEVHPAHWILLSIAILGLDYLTGPYIQLTILFVFPVALATWGHGRLWGSVVATALPLVRLPFYPSVWEIPNSWALEAADTAIDIFVLLALVRVIDHIARQQREIRVLQGLLPICGFCKRIRDESGGWLQLERYIGDRSEARFSHTFCPDCGRIHYGDLVK